MKPHYDFKIITPNDYELILSYPVKNKILETIFSKTIKKINKERGTQIEGELQALDRFEVDKRFLNLLRTNLKKHVRQVSKEVAQDKIIILSDRVKKATFNRTKKDDWVVTVVIIGDYSDQRYTRY